MNTKVTERATITIQRITPPTGNRRSATIKDIDGLMFGVWPDKLGIFREGETYEIEYTVNDKGFRDIVTGKMVQQAVQQRQAPQQQHHASPSTQPQGAGNTGQYYRPTSPKDARRMFLCATLGDFVQTGRVDLHRESIAIAITEILAAYDVTVGQEDPR